MDCPSGVLAHMCHNNMTIWCTSTLVLRLQSPTPPSALSANTIHCGRLQWNPILFKIVEVGELVNLVEEGIW